MTKEVWHVGKENFSISGGSYYLGKSMHRLTTGPDEYAAKFDNEEAAKKAADYANNRKWKTRMPSNKFEPIRYICN